jgi:hypothetical protein
MPEKLAGAVQQFTDDVGRLHTPLAVLVALQNLSHGMLGVEVLGAWILPRYFKDQAADWREGENLFFHPDVPRTFWPDYLKQYAEKGYSALRLKARRRSLSPRPNATDLQAKPIGYSVSCAAITCATVCIARIARGQPSLFQLK